MHGVTVDGGHLPILAASQGPKHHFFGFHDLVQWDARGNLMLALEVDDIAHPPLPGQTARVGVVDPQARAFISVAETCAFNYPQGARQQWVDGGRHFLFNDRVGDGWGCRIADAETCRVVETLPFAVHTHDATRGLAFGIDYARLHRVGGYGYSGLNDACAADDLPDSNGIHRGQLTARSSELLVSIREVAACGEARPVVTGYPHYVTHLVLNPSCSRLAFLHRYRLADGGEMTRLMTVGADGRGLRCLSKGFLSHFDWLDDRTVLIWGQIQAVVSGLRESRLLKLPGAAWGAEMAKRAFRPLLRRIRSGVPSRSFLAVTDADEPAYARAGVGVLTGDGHPMCCPADRSWMVNDTYPDSEGFRTLMLYHVPTNRRVDLGRFRMLDARPDPARFDVEAARAGLDPRIKARFALDQYLFTRSGLHCDLHPRWKADGTAVAFDSIHEGTRQIYQVPVAGLLQTPDGIRS